MEGASLSANPKLVPLRRITKKPASSHNQNRLIATRRRAVIKSKQGHLISHEEGESVDENPVILKIDLKKMKFLLEASKNQDDQERILPSSSDLIEWERKLLNDYQVDVFEVIELLLSSLMSTRPSLALGVLAMMAMSVPFTESVFLENLFKVAKRLLGGSHVCIDFDF